MDALSPICFAMGMTDGIVLAEGPRADWSELPPEVRTAIEGLLGWQVTSARTQRGGFSPGVAARLRGANGERAFVKAISAQQNADTPRIHRREAVIAAALPARAPVPQLLGVYDDEDWVALLFTDIDGRLPHVPWTTSDLDAVAGGVTTLHHELTPSPVPDAPSILDELEPIMACWQHLADDQDRLAKADGWTRRNLRRLVTLTEGWDAEVAGDTLLHGDLRADNMLVTADGLVVVDWPWAARGAAWVDVALMAPSIASQGGPAPADLLALFPATRSVPVEVVTPLVVGLAGYFVYASLGPAPDGIPTLRPFQAMQGRAACQWVRQLTGLD